MDPANSVFLSGFDPFTANSNTPHGFPASSAAAAPDPLPSKTPTRPKLDEDRLMQPDALPYLRTAGRSIQFRKEKNCELENLGKLLDFYKHWAHTVYPHFTFDRFIERIMVLTHKKQLKNLLHQWIRDDFDQARHLDDINTFLDATLDASRPPHLGSDSHNPPESPTTDSINTQLRTLSVVNHSNALVEPTTLPPRSPPLSPSADPSLTQSNGTHVFANLEFGLDDDLGQMSY